MSVIVHRHPHSLNILSSETTGPIKVKFHLQLLWDGGTKICSNGPGHMTKMAAMTIYGKNLKPEDHWSCIAHLSAEDVLKSEVIEEEKFKYIESE